ncbi:hypothetical protein T484DRAFT_1615936 [Baffinella frigidus]|nr:hypothetical protein T484DRAFT_1615936 [Cryptophyta sp. CCMP2293]
MALRSCCKTPVAPWSKPQTLNPQPSTLNPQLSTLNPQPSTLDPQPSTLNTQPSTLNPQPSTLNPGPSTRNLPIFATPETPPSIHGIRDTQHTKLPARHPMHQIPITKQHTRKTWMREGPSQNLPSPWSHFSFMKASETIIRTAVRFRHPKREKDRRDRNSAQSHMENKCEDL